jgi:SAM-dependent methyltransferase
MYYYWSARLGMEVYPSRKQWEDIVIVQALWERGCLAPGKTAVGFGVGKERLAALFASYGCKVLATDQVLTPKSKAVWQSTGQLSTDKGELFFPEIIDWETFDANVEFENCDMNDIPDSYRNRFDFTYSACSLDHLGTITHGMKFIENSLMCLKPGGWAVHTTEYNVGSNKRTVERGATVYWRKKDIEDLTRILRQKGYFVEGTDFSRGAHAENYAVDHPPYKQHHTVLFAGGQTISSILVMAQRPETMTAISDNDGIEWPFIGKTGSSFTARLKRGIRKRLRKH